MSVAMPASGSSSEDSSAQTLSPPSFGLEPPNVASPRSEDSRDSSNCAGETQNATVPTEDRDGSPPLKRAAGMLNGEDTVCDSASRAESRRRSAMNASCSGEKRAATKVCRVCGDKAFSYNFNVITCESCKAFFRRNANKEKGIRCPFNGHCDITIVSRRFCQRCRLRKCFDVGMKREWIMTDEARIEKKHRVQENRERRAAEVTLSFNDLFTPLNAPIGDGNSPDAVSQGKPLKRMQDEHSPSPSLLLDVKLSPPEEKANIPLNILPPTSAIYNSSLPSLVGTPTSLTEGSGAFRELNAPGSVESLPSPRVSSAGFRPPILTDPKLNPSCSLITSSSASIIHTHNAFMPAHQQRVLASQVSQQVHLAQVQMQQAQLEQELQQQASAHQIAAQLATQSQQLAHSKASAISGICAVPTRVINPSPQIPPYILPHSVQRPSPISPSISMESAERWLSTLSNGDELVTIPKKVLLRLVEQNNSLKSTDGFSSPLSPIPRNCSCTCLCGHYPSGKRIADQVVTDVMADLKANPEGCGLKAISRKPSRSCSMNGIHSDESTASSSSRSLFKSSSLLEHEMNNVKVDTECRLMTSTDYDHLNELKSANGVWAELEPNSAETARHEERCPSKTDMVNMADGAIRRMIKMVKRIDLFRRLNEHDQLQLLKNSCMEYLILRGAMSYDPEMNAWKGPTIDSGYNIKMDGMKDTQTNMFESSIRFYSTFKEEWRTNDSVMLVLGMIVIFNSDFPDLHDRAFVVSKNREYKLLLKRLLYTLCDEDQKRTNVEWKGLLDKMDSLKEMNSRAQAMLKEVGSADMEPLLVEMFH